MINALGINPFMPLQPNMNQASQTFQAAPRSFEDALGSAMTQNDIVSRLRSLGVPVIVRDTPKQSNSLGSNGVTIAPNIIRKMEQDEEYAQEIMNEINYFLYEFLPESNRNIALQGGKMKWAGMSIDSEGKVVMWSGGVPKQEDDSNSENNEFWNVLSGKEKVKDKESISATYVSCDNSDYDLSAHSALFGSINLKIQRRVKA
jgi:hypothetical protein